MTESASLPAMTADEIGLCRVRRGSITARTAFEPVVALGRDSFGQVALKARTECTLAGKPIRCPDGRTTLASGDPAFDLACALAHIHNFALTEDAGSRLQLGHLAAPEALFDVFMSRLEEEFADGMVDPGQLVFELSASDEVRHNGVIAERLRGSGIALCLTDFGDASAASSLIEVVRPAFVQFGIGWLRRAAGIDPAGRLLGSLVGLLRQQEITVMIEGVAREGELEIAQRAGIGLACGPFIAPAFAAGIARCHRQGPQPVAASVASQATIIRLTG